MRRPPLSIIVLLTTALAGPGCGKLFDRLFGSDEDAPAEEPAGVSGSKPSPTDECGGADFPCSWVGVSEEVIERTHTVAAEAMGFGAVGLGPKRIAEELAKEDDVAVLGYSESAIRYRVRGGRPAWVFLATANTIDERQTLGGPITLSPLAWMGPPTPPSGPQKKGERPNKRALLLSPFRWQWQLGGNDDEIERVQDYLDNLQDYQGEGSVVLRQNTWNGSGIDFGVSTADFESWAEYDVIHVSTHGTSCDETGLRCATSLATGDIWPDLLTKKGPVGSTSLDVREMLRDDLLGRGFDMGFMPVSKEAADVMATLPGLRIKEHVKPVGMKPSTEAHSDTDDNIMAGGTDYSAGPFVLANTRFFELAYEEPLTDKIIFLSACKSGAKSDLMTTLAGPATAVIGWDKVMGLTKASRAAALFWFKMARPSSSMDLNEEEGRATVQQAFRQLEEGTLKSGVIEYGDPKKSIEIEGIVTEDDATGAKMEPTGELGTRAGEIIRLLDDAGKRQLEDGDFVSMVGAPGDGDPDSLEIHAQLVGIGDEDDVDAYVVHLDIDGREAKGTLRPTEKVGDGVWRAKGKVELGFDLTDDPFVLEPWVEMPTGGISRWYYEKIGAQYFTITVSGPAIPSPQTFAIPPNHSGFHAHEGGGFLTMFRAEQVRLSVSEDRSVLEWMIGGMDVPGFDDGGTQPLGRSEGGSNGWSLKIFLQAADGPANYEGADAVGLKTLEGTFDIEEIRFGRGLYRPHGEGPTVLRASFRVDAKGINVGHKGETYTIEGKMALAE